MIPNESNIIDVWNYKRQAKDNYTGPLFQAFHRDTTAGTNDFYDVPQAADGTLDIDALETWRAGRKAGIRRIYGQNESYDLLLRDDNINDFLWSNERFAVITDENDDLALDGDGFLSTVVTGETTSWKLVSASDDSAYIPPSTFSLCVMQKVSFSDSDADLFGSDNQTSTRGVIANQGSPLTDLTLNLGTPSVYIDDAVFTSDQGTLYTTLNGAGWKMISVFGANYASGTQMYIFDSRYAWEDAEYSTILLYSTDESSNVSSINTYMNDLLSPPDLKPSGSVTFPTGTLYSGVADIYKAPYASKGTPTFVEQVAILGGTFTGTVSRDDTEETYAVLRGISDDFSGTVTSASGNDLTLDADLSGTSIGGASDNHYLFEATGGTGSGEVVTVTARSGNVITVPDGSLFDDTTEYVLGRLVKDVTYVLPKS